MSTTLSPDDLLTSVWLWVLKLSHRYGPQYGLDPGDVANETALRVLSKAHMYDPAKARPTVWVQKVCWRVALRLAEKRGLVGGRLRRLDTSGWTDQESVYGPSREPVPGADDEREEEIADAKREAAAVLARLGKTDRAMLVARYGIGDGRERRLIDVGRKFNVSKQRASQRLAASLASLRGAAPKTTPRPASTRHGAGEDLVAALAAAG